MSSGWCAQVLSGPELFDANWGGHRSFVTAAKAAGGRCHVHAALQSHVDSDRIQEAPIQMIRAGACNYYDQGVDGLYLAHWFNVSSQGSSIKLQYMCIDI